MMISMEGSERTDAILDLHERLCQRFDHIGITLQAYLYRSQDDLATLLQRPGRIRLVKGAYAEPESKALARGDELNAAYVALLETLLVSGHACSIASHDPELLGHAHRFISERDVRREPIEFEMLYGVTPERLEEKLRQGYRTRVYMVYGVEWYLYLCHRLAEHPPNIFRAITDIVGIEQH
ncbi:MAG: proline dehydrogenase family protein [Gammaproteobacteria bacterium]